MLRLWFAPRTRSVRILWLLEELGLPYEGKEHEPFLQRFSNAALHAAPGDPRGVLRGGVVRWRGLDLGLLDRDAEPESTASGLLLRVSKEGTVLEDRSGRGLLDVRRALWLRVAGIRRVSGGIASVCR